jgi:hypothetical protein
MGKSLSGALLCVLVVSSLVWASKPEKEAKKLDREFKRISLTAAVPDGRRVVNRVMAQQLGVGRAELVHERKQTGFVYGQIFGAHEVAHLSGLTFSQVTEQMKQGHSLLEISEQHQIDLREILADAKKLNKSIERELDRVASGDENEQAEDTADAYDPSGDSLTADTADFSPAQIAQAAEQVHNPGLHLGQGGPFGAGQGSGSALGRTMGAGHGHGPH